MGSDSNGMVERMPVCIVRLQKGVNKPTIRAEIEALPGIKHVDRGDDCLINRYYILRFGQNS